MSLGGAQGLKIGDKLRVYKEVPVTDSKGKVVYSEEKEIGVLTVTDVQADRSKAALSTGAAVSEGLIVRRQ